jgi:AcrR family transcriptional regulator
LEAKTTRRRGAELEAAILRAAWEEVTTVGYTHLTMEGVADRAQTGKQVLYRRWPNRAQLVLAALRHRVVPIVDRVPDTGDLRGDVLDVLRLMADRFHDVGPDIVHGLLAEVSDIGPGPLEVMRDVMDTILRRAAARGEIRMEAITRRITTVPTDLLRYEMLLTRDPDLETSLIEIVDDVFLPLVRARSGDQAAPSAVTHPQQAGTPSLGTDLG